MKQLLQRYDTGALDLADVPVPRAGAVQLVVEARASVISAGTERAMVETARANLLEKARKRPDQVRQVLDKLRTDGLAPTLEAVRTKLRDPVPLGYCSAGVVVDAGARAGGFVPGDRVATNGAHAEYVRVPHTLAARIPDSVDFETAAFTPVAAIALQGIRLASPTLGETIVVYGLGLIGLLAVQLLRAHGCRVIGVDRDAARLALAHRFGATTIDGGLEDVVARVMAETKHMGADAVLLTLAATSDEPVHHAAALSRQRGRIVLVGVTGLALRREDFYRKELSFTVSCSYGPGRYDPRYEDEAHDYPIGFVRWTEQRNFEAVLQLMATRALEPRPLITHRFPFARAHDAYALITSREPSLGVVLEYPDRGGVQPAAGQRTIRRRATVPASGAAADAVALAADVQTRRALPTAGRAAVIGAGAFAQRVLIPAIRDVGFMLHTVASGSGTGAAVAGETFDFAQTSTDVDAVLDAADVDTVFVLTRHDTHARFARRALEAGKHVFVEKPLALDETELDALDAAARNAGTLLTVGFNRRYAPLARELADATSGRAGPLSLIITVNAGALPREHWTQHPEQGGGRIVGEACHFIDLARAIIGAPIGGAGCVSARAADGAALDDIAHITLAFADGSTAAIHYLACGSKAFPKERIEAFWDGRTAVIDNWRRLRRYGTRGPGLARARRQDKGHAAELVAWHGAVTKGGPAPIPLDELLEVSRWSIRLASLARGQVAGRADALAHDAAPPTDAT